MSFTKTTPGKACKVAAVMGAEWTILDNSVVHEASVGGDVVAYKDATGWFVKADLEHVNTAGVAA